jgi:hypothetical protein
MKRNLCVLALIIISVTGKLFAQEISETAADKVFDASPKYFRYDFFINLDQGNKIELQLSMVSDLDHFSDIDSLLRGVAEDLKLLKDSLSNPVTVKRIDYVIDNKGRKKIRIQQNAPRGTSFLLQGTDLSLLKLEQDTIYIPGSVAHIQNGNDKVVYNKPYLLRIYLNNLDELSAYLDGRLNKAIAEIRQDAHNTHGWWDSKKKWIELSANYTVTKDKTIGSINQKYVANDYLRLLGSANVGNYKNYFVPSFSVGAMMHFSGRQVQKEFSMFWEPNFFFGKNPAGNLTAYRNDFLAAYFKFGMIQDNNPKKPLAFSFSLSLAYLIHREGDFVDPHTFRFGLGRASFLGGNYHLEPLVYFNNFFRGVTPGLKFTVDFGPQASKDL